MPMFCTNCGKEIDDGAEICIHCGRKVKQGNNPSCSIINSSGDNLSHVSNSAQEENALSSQLGQNFSHITPGVMGCICELILGLIGLILGSFYYKKTDDRKEFYKGWSICFLVQMCIVVVILFVVFIIRREKL